MASGGYFRMPGGGLMHVRGSGLKLCAHCALVSERLCDFPVGKGKTCSQPLCPEHAHPVAGAKDMDFCPVHASLYAANGASAATFQPTTNIVRLEDEDFRPAPTFPPFEKQGELF